MDVFFFLVVVEMAIKLMRTGRQLDAVLADGTLYSRDDARHWFFTEQGEPLDIDTMAEAHYQVRGFMLDSAWFDHASDLFETFEATGSWPRPPALGSDSTAVH